MRRTELIRNFKTIRSYIDTIIQGLEDIDTDDPNTKRIVQTDITITVFNMMDTLSETEVALYNYLHRRGWK